MLLLFAALVLLGTATLHASGTTAVSGWLSGHRAEILVLLWLSPSVTWSAVALALVYVGLRGDRRSFPVVAVLAVVPGSAALGLGVVYSWSFPGVWLLAAAASLMIGGAARLPRRPRECDAPCAAGQDLP
jgi:hypothetical protein